MKNNQKQETEYQSFGARYYESTNDWKTKNYPATIQRSIEVELQHYITGGSTTILKLHDYVSGYEWTGKLGDLIDILVKSKVEVTAGIEK